MSKSELFSTETQARVLDAAGTMVIATDPEGLVQLFNPAAEQMLGWSADEVVGSETPELWHDPFEVEIRAGELSLELGRPIAPNFEVFVAKVRDCDMETRQWTFIRRDGIRFPVQLVVTTLRDDAGELLGFIGTAQDLSARVKAEQERDRIFELSLDMLGIANTLGYFTRVNPAFRETLGWTSHELCSRPFLDFVHPDDREATLREMESLAQGKLTIHFENRYRCRDGSWTWISWNVKPLPDGTLYATARNVTQLKQAEQALRESQQSLSFLFESIGDAVLATDADRRVTMLNPVAERLTGWRLEEAQGRPIEEVFHIIHERTRQPAVIPIDEVLATGNVQALANHTLLIARDGSECPIADSAAPIRDAEHNIVGVVLVFRDASEESRYQRALEELNADLERRVKQRTAELAKSEQRLRAGNLALESIAADVPLVESLELVARFLKCEDPVAVCAILPLHPSGQRLVEGAGSQLPGELSSLLDGITKNQLPRSWREALDSGLRQVVPDLRASDEFRFLAERLDAKLRACWVQPIRETGGTVLGLFVVFSQRGGAPEPEDIERIECASMLARLAIERWRRQSALLESERFNRATIDAIPARVAVLNDQGMVVAANAPWRQDMLSDGPDWQAACEGENFLAACDQAAASGDGAASVAAAAIRQVLTGERDSGFHEYTTYVGQNLRWLIFRVSRFPDDGPVHAVVSHEDVTVVLKTRQQLHDVRARFETLDRVSPVAIIFFDADGHCLDVNQRFCELAGLDRQAARGEGWLRAVHPDDRTRIAKQWNKSVRAGKNFEAEFRYRRPNSQVVWIAAQAMAILDADGQVTGFVRVSTDVTEQKLTEQTLRYLSSDLATLHGREFYEAAARELARLVQCEWAYICQVDPGAAEQASTLALVADGAIVPNFTYSLADTPCRDVTAGASCVISSGARELYPRDPFLSDNRVEAYVGVPLIDKQGSLMGHLGVMSRQLVSHGGMIEKVVKLFAVSVAAEMERQSNERRFSDLFEFSPDAIVITNHAGTIELANRQVQAVFGWSPQELIGKPIEWLVPPKYRAAHRRARELYIQPDAPHAMGGGRAGLYGLRKDGSTFPVDVSLSPLRTPGGQYVIAAARDISDRRRAEQALQEAKAFSDMVIDNVAGIFYVVDQNGAFVRWNKELPKLLGLTEEQMSGATALDFVHPDDQPKIAGKIAEAFGVGHSRDEARMISTIGYRHFLLNAHRVQIGEAVYLAGSGFDITDRHQAEQEILALNQNLEQRVLERTEQLSKANEELQSASQAKSDFLSTMSHELRTPLNGILGMNELLLKTPLSEEQRRYVDASRTSGRLLLSLINDVLDISKIEAGMLELDPCPCHLETLVRDVLKIFTSRAREKAIALECKLDHETCLTILCDDNRLRQVLVNLVGNALKFTASGSVTVHSTCLGREGNRILIRLAVCDTGVGIPVDQQHRLFAAFTQIDSSTSRRFGGTGLGLSISRQLVEMMGGAIGVDSRPGQGSTFWIELPTTIVAPREGELAGELQAGSGLGGVAAAGDEPWSVAGPEPPTSGREETQAASGQGPRSSLDGGDESQSAIVSLLPTSFVGHVLVAEDNGINQMYVRELLRHFGCTSDIANNGREALGAVQQRAYDLILMDCQMPETDGFTAAREIRQRQAAGTLPPGLPIVALTANALQGDRDRCLAAGMDDYVSKPLQAEQLRSILHRYLPTK